MSVLPIQRFYRLSDAGVRCDKDGLFVGGAPLLARSPWPSEHSDWTPRSAKELDCDLSDIYGLAIDGAAKRGGLASVARALASDDLALAKIAAVLLRFPDPPALAKGGRREAQWTWRASSSRVGCSSGVGTPPSIPEQASRLIPAGSRRRTTVRRGRPFGLNRRQTMSFGLD